MNKKLIPLAILGLCGLNNQAIAEENASKTNLSPVVVTATRTEQNSFDVPASIDSVDLSDIQDQKLKTNLSESLNRVSGLIVSNRQNYAQDLQVSSRGFGARAPFGVKGIRIVVDDIPATMPDGQGQGATIPLGSTNRIEVLRGPFSALYGNGAGGVIQAFTENGEGSPKVTNTFSAGSYSTTREELKVSGKEGTVGYLADSSWFSTDGYRAHSKTDRNQANAKLDFDLSEDTKIKLTANSFWQTAEDPLGLTSAQVAYNPRMAGGSSSSTGTNPTSLTYNSSKTISYNQAGLVLDQKISDTQSIKIIPYYGTRKVTQLQSFQALGVVDLDRSFGGLNIRYNYAGKIAEHDLSITAGLDYDKMVETRKAFNNNSGVVDSTLQRNEDDTVYNLDPYIQGQFKVTEKWDVTGGLRYNNVNFRIDDKFNAAGSANYNSGTVSYSETTPSMGVVYHASPSLNIYANAGRGFETPTFAEISYSLYPSGSVNTSKSTLLLKPAKSTTYEIGAKTFLTDNSQLNVALFTTEVTDEIAAANNSGGKVAYQNIPKTQRNGLELSLNSKWNYGLETYASYTFLDAYVDQSYSKKVSGTAQTISSGSQIPGVSKSSLYGEAKWSYEPLGFSTTFEANWRSKYYATDLNDAVAKSFVVANISAGFNQKFSHWKLSEFARVNNLFDRSYIGSVIINESNSRFYEPGAERNWLIGVNASYQF